LKKIIAIVFLLSVHFGFSQKIVIDAFRDSLFELTQERQIGSLFQNYTDSLYKVLDTVSNDSVRIWVMTELCNNYKYRRPDSTIYFARKAIELSRKLNMRESEAWAILYFLLTESAIGNDAKALHLALQYIKLAEEYDLPLHRAQGIMLSGWIYNRSKQYRKAITNYKVGLDYFISVNDESFASITASYIGETYSILNQKDSALYYCKLAESYTGRAVWVTPFVTLHIGKVYTNLEDYEKALYYLHKARLSAGPIEAYWEFQATKELARLKKTIHEDDSALYFGFQALMIANNTGFFSNIIEANQFLSDFFKTSDPERALVYNATASQYKDSLSHLERSMTIKDFVSIDEAQRQSELEAAKKEFQYRLKMNALMGSSFTLLVVAFVLYRSRKAKQKAKKHIEEAYDRLKNTQSQLIQSEKMASLGELTAGIAHEIQNPLNFVNNFSEVSIELISELEAVRRDAAGKSSKVKGEMDKKLEEELKQDIYQNLEKIKYHGKRASEIVKSMLQHSRTGTGEKELTDINALCDEYLRLAYHGMRAKDKSFNAEYKLELDPGLPKIKVVPQEIGRVLLNLINNAFQAVAEAKQPSPEATAVAGAKETAVTGIDNPKVTLMTQLLNNSITIRIADNGPGIPEHVRDKIFQPFFTTKPTGSGTGLGLSLSSDIIKAHMGSIEVESEDGKGSEFIITIPIETT
jgi:signal transduction histidine kinase